MSGGKGGSKTSTSTSTVSVPSWLENELQNGVEQSRSLYDQGAPAYYSGDTTANFTPAQLQAQQAITNRATNGSPVVQAAQNLATNTLNGDYLNGSPQLDDLLARYGAKANSTVLGSFNKTGRLGSGANVATSQQAIGDATLPYLFQNYQNERGLQNSAAGMATNLANNDYTDLAALNGVGDTQQQQNQTDINADMAKYSYDSSADSNWLDQYLNRINTSGANNLTTNTQTTTTPKSGGGLGSILGTALSLGSMFVPGGQLAGLGTSLGGGLSSLLGGFGSQAVGGLMSSSPTGPYLPYGLCDARMKENIERVGTENGFPMYAFNYRGNSERFIGPMAQDIEKTMPDAVFEVDGIKHVDLAKAGVSIRKAN